MSEVSKLGQNRGRTWRKHYMLFKVWFFDLEVDKTVNTGHLFHKMQNDCLYNAAY